MLCQKCISRVNYGKEKNNKNQDIIWENVSQIADNWKQTVGSLDKLSVYLYTLREQNQSEFISLNEELAEEEE